LTQPALKVASPDLLTLSLGKRDVVKMLDYLIVVLMIAIVVTLSFPVLRLFTQSNAHASTYPIAVPAPSFSTPSLVQA